MSDHLEDERKSLLDEYNDLVDGREKLKDTRDLLVGIEKNGTDTSEKINIQGTRTRSWEKGIFGNYKQLKNSEKLIDRISRRMTIALVCKIILLLMIIAAIGTIIYFVNK